LPEQTKKRGSAQKAPKPRAKTLSAGDEHAQGKAAPTADKKPRARKAKPEAADDTPAPAAAAETETGRPGLHALWTGTLGFGLVAIPVELFPASRSGRPSLRMLAEDGTPLVRRSFDESGRMLDKSEITRAYEVEKDRFVEVTDEELDALAPEDGKDIKLSVFVDRASISPMYFERGYVLTPSKGSNSAYRLLAHTLVQTGQVGVATFVMHDSEHLVCIHAEHGVLRAEILRFAAEVRTPDAIGLPAAQEPSEAALSAAERALAALQKGERGTLLPHDAHRKKLEELTEHKLREKADLVPVREAEAVDDTPPEELADVVDLVSVLRRSLAQGGAKKGAKR
jgi:DNA end-binding protein Ku